MLSTQYRLRLEGICNKIALQEQVSLEDMVWAEKLAKANTSAREMLKRARGRAANPDMQEGSMDDFMNKMGLGDPDPSNHRTGVGSVSVLVCCSKHWVVSFMSISWVNISTNRHFIKSLVKRQPTHKLLMGHNTLGV